MPAADGIHDGFWFKNVASIHDRLALQLGKYLQEVHTPEWMTKRKTTLILKDPPHTQKKSSSVTID